MQEIFPLVECLTLMKANETYKHFFGSQREKKQRWLNKETKHISTDFLILLSSGDFWGMSTCEDVDKPEALFDK